jgi:hypothetical protein
LAASLSLLASFADNHFTYVLSGDSVLYLQTATIYLNQGLQGAIDSFSWPFISILIGLTHQVTGMSLALTGHVIIAIFYALLTCTFISIVRELGGSQKVQLLAMLVIIIFPTINDYRSYITRDAGYWLFSLVSLLQLLRFVIYDRYRHAIGWLLSISLAISFRTEGLFLAALSPLTILADGHLEIRQRIKNTIYLYAPLVCIGLIAVAVTLATPALNEKLRIISQLANINTFFFELHSYVSQQINHYASVTANPFIASDMDVIFISGLLGLGLFTPLHALTLPYLILLGWPVVKKVAPPLKLQIYPVSYFLIALGYLLLFSFKRHYITDRYSVMGVLSLMLLLPFYIDRIWGFYSKISSKISWQKVIMVILLLYSGLDSMISSGSSKEYISKAAYWVSANAPAESSFMTNHAHIAFAGKRCYPDCFERDTIAFFSRVKDRDVNYLAFRLKHKEGEGRDQVNALLATSHWQVIKSFSNERDDKVMILIRNP